MCPIVIEVKLYSPRLQNKLCVIKYCDPEPTNCITRGHGESKFGHQTNMITYFRFLSTPRSGLKMRDLKQITSGTIDASSAENHKERFDSTVFVVPCSFTKILQSCQGERASFWKPYEMWMIPHPIPSLAVIHVPVQRSLFRQPINSE